MTIVIRDIVRNWTQKRRLVKFLAPALASYEAGDTAELDIEDIKTRGRERLAKSQGAKMV